VSAGKNHNISHSIVIGMLLHLRVTLLCHFTIRYFVQSHIPCDLYTLCYTAYDVLIMSIMSFCCWHGTDCVSHLAHCVWFLVFSSLPLLVNQQRFVMLMFLSSASIRTNISSEYVENRRKLLR